MPIKIAFRIWNPIQNIIKPYSQIDKYEKSGMYQMKCLNCPLNYIGRTGKRTFHTRYKEHIQAIRSNNGNSVYSYRILNTGYTYGTINYERYEYREKRKTIQHGRKLPFIQN
jgi:hypothetical protein